MSRNDIARLNQRTGTGTVNAHQVDRKTTGLALSTIPKTEVNSCGTEKESRFESILEMR